MPLTVWKRALWVLGGILAAGAIIGAFVNARAIVTPRVTYWGTAGIAVGAAALHSWLRIRGIEWSTGTQHVRLRGLGISIISATAGALLLLWFPRLPLPVLLGEPPTSAPLDQRYAAVIGQLGAVDRDNKPAIPVRIAAMMELGAVARASRDWRPRVIQVLCSYLRTNANRWAREELRVAPPPDDWVVAVTLLSDTSIVSDSLSAFIDLTGAMLYRMDLTHVHFRRAILVGADFFEADLSFADLRDADLSGAYLASASLYGADLRGALMVEREHLDPADAQETEFDSSDVRGATFLYVDHMAPDQLIGARIDSATRLPPGTRRQP